MSRVPPRSPQKSPQKSQPRTPATGSSRSRIGSPLTVGASTPPRIRTKSTPKTFIEPSTSRTQDQDNSLSVKTNLSIREAIALKRAEAKKAVSKSTGRGLDGLESLEDALSISGNIQGDDEVFDLGRWSVRETIERARSTGSLNISSRSLPCIPSALFEIHLGITPDALKSVPSEPSLGPSSNSTEQPRRGTKRDAPSWFEAQDLHILKAWSNDIVEIQHEISLFGSLKTVDLHQNRIESLPDTFVDLTFLTSLDLSHNVLTSLPVNLFALPSLSFLNVSHNALDALPFNSPFSNSNSNSRPTYFGGGSFFAPTIIRATTPLPSLLTLDASHNKIPASAIDHDIGNLPLNLSKLDLSANPLALESIKCRSLVQALGKLEKLRELRMEHAEIGDDQFTPDMFSVSSSTLPFPALRVLDLGETLVTAEATRTALMRMKQELSFDVTTEEPPDGVVRVIIGKKVVREPWELDAERRVRARAAKFGDVEPRASPFTSPKHGSGEAPKQVAKEPWEVDAEQEALTEGARRRARAAAAAAAAAVANTPEPQTPVKQAPSERTVVKEAWEIEAEQGLLTEGGRRRARIAAAAAAAANKEEPVSNSPVSPSPSTSNLTLSSPQYYSVVTQTLTLPSSSPPSKAPGHSRAFSLAASSSSDWLSTSRTTHIAVPTPSVPLAVISAQPFAQRLKILILANRRMDRSFSLPVSADGVTEALLPNLEELNLEGCGFGDMVNVTRQSSGVATPPRSNELLLPLLTRLFPSLRSLDLSYNVLTSAALTTEALSPLILSSPGDTNQFPRQGLKHLRLRGNRITELDGLRGIAQLFRGNRDVPSWKLDELDLRDNEINKLPPELGLMPLDVFLVDGNIFRVPQRRVWEREGTKGLLNWLRGRIE